MFCLKWKWVVALNLFAYSGETAAPAATAVLEEDWYQRFYHVDLFMVCGYK